MSQSVVRIPVDIEREDKILAGLTARQVVILAVTGVVVWLCYTTIGRWVPLPVFAVVALVVCTAGGALALSGRDGLTADRYLLAALRYAVNPRLRVLAPEGLPSPPAWIAAQAGGGKAPAPLVLPIIAVHDDGLIELGDHRVAVIAEASTVGFAFRSPGEQRALVGAFARWLNSLTAPVQILVCSQWVDLGPFAATLVEDAPALPHPALEQAAREHAAFLAELNEETELLRRQVLLVFVEPRRSQGGEAWRSASEQLWRRVEAAAQTLAAAEITVTALDGGRAGAVLAAASNPFASLRLLEGWSAPGQTVTAPDAADQTTAAGDDLDGQPR
ncbi:PrgI family protein [Actinomadura sp. 6N118]|uniref:PrgI family protein n=1 Tax=Actinomadura sp. 6N118 TaxID=3375151 RepID=UPI0037B148AE